jgi:hypothetical protein
MWCTEGSSSDDDQVGAAAVCNYRNEWRSRPSFLGTRRKSVFNTKLWAIRLGLDVVIEKREPLQIHGVGTVAVFSNLQATIRRAAHLELGPRQRQARQINRW